jgi:hypothetical protein
MILTKTDFEVFGFKHVIVYDQPVIILLGKAVVARLFKYDSITELKKHYWFKDQLFLQTPILLCKIKLKSNNNSNKGICFRMFWLGE